MGKKTIYFMIFLIGYFIGAGIFAMLTFTIPSIQQFIMNFLPWLGTNMWFLQSMISGLAGSFIALLVVFLWSRSSQNF